MEKLVMKYTSTVDDQLFRKSESDAGFDVRAGEAFYLGPGEIKSVKTGLNVAIPKGYVGILKPRSGLALKYGIEVLGGVIDENYRGEVRVVLFMPKSEEQNGSLDFKIGNRIAQMLVVPRPDITLEKVDTLEELGETDRGANGFGSSGVE